jgi:hypothetical protein
MAATTLVRQNLKIWVYSDDLVMRMLRPGGRLSFVVTSRRLKGHTVDEIAARLGCARRTVARRLELIRTLWRAAAG